MKVGDFEVKVVSARVGKGWQAEGILPNGQKIISGPCSSREDAEHDIEQQAKARLYPQRRYDVNRPFESLGDSYEGFIHSQFWYDAVGLVGHSDKSGWNNAWDCPYPIPSDIENELASLGPLPPWSKLRWLWERRHLFDSEINQQYESMNLDEKKAKLGSGARFASLERKLSHKKGIRDPAAVAAAHGRKTLGKKRFQQLAAAGRRRHSESLERRYPDLTESEEAVVMHQANQLLESPEDVYEIDGDGGLIENPECPACGGPGVPLGSLGSRQHFRCRNCGSDFSQESTPPPKAAFYPSDGGTAGGGGGLTTS